MGKGWIGVDLDGTLAEAPAPSFYEIGEPNPAMVKHVKKLLFTDGKEVRIFTSRVAEQSSVVVRMQTEVINKWCMKNLGVMLPVTAIKTKSCIQIIDNIAINPKDI